MRLLQEELELEFDYRRDKDPDDVSTRLTMSAINYGMIQGFIKKDGNDYYYVNSIGRMKIGIMEEEKPKRGKKK